MLISNDHTASVVAPTQQLITTPLHAVKDFESFLAEVGPIVDRCPTVMTFGDSTSTNYSSWPSYLSELWPDAAIVNLADWSLRTVDHFFAINHCLRWARQRSRMPINVVIFGGILDAAAKLDYFKSYCLGSAKDPLLINERWLSTHRLGGEIRELAGLIPVGMPDRWIARRMAAVARLYKELCAELDARFTFVLQPLGFPDLAPGHIMELKSLHAASQSDLPLEAWVKPQGYHIDPTSRLEFDVRDTVEMLGRLLSDDFSFNLSGLLKHMTEPPFNSRMDAIHYSATANKLIAAAISDRLSEHSAKAFVGDPVQVGSFGWPSVSSKTALD